VPLLHLIFIQTWHNFFFSFFFFCFSIRHLFFGTFTFLNIRSLHNLPSIDTQPTKPAPRA
jgi:hypothetical protein